MATLFLSSMLTLSQPENQQQTYIIQLDPNHKPSPFSTHHNWHISILSTLHHPISDHLNQTNLLYSYSHVFTGFSCRLSPSQLTDVESLAAHIATFPERFGKVMTTYTPSFLGLNHMTGLWPNSSYGDGTTIGVLDTGIWPHSESFGEDGMPAVPEKWKGECEERFGFKSAYCNRKLIGYRFFSKGAEAAGNDDQDHGTHVSSTAAGNFVTGTSFFGLAKGTASGIAPRAHLAMYKVGWSDEDVTTTDVLAAMDRAIDDGVDIMSLSLGFGLAPYYEDVIAMGAISAAEKGIFVSCAAANRPFLWILNTAPWITTVGAGSIGRRFTAKITLADYDDHGVKEIEGFSYFPLDILAVDIPLYYRPGVDGCQARSLNRSEVEGRIVLCDGVSAAEVQFDLGLLLRKAGAFGAVLISSSPELTLYPETSSAPLVAVSRTSGDLLRNYVQRGGGTKLVSVKFQLTNIGVKPAPQVAEFSCRGPDPVNPTILKPDVLAPGVEILAAYPGWIPYMTFGEYKLITDYAFKSGTSMAAPHVAGLAALLKSLHRDWSPAAVKSAIMTTSYTVDNAGGILTDQITGRAASPLDFGAGHIDPNRAMDPGLIYDIQIQDYVDFLCGLNFTRKQMDTILRRRDWNCRRPVEAAEFNYPSPTAVFETGTKYPRSITFRRTLSNVGNAKSVYRASLEHVPSTMRIQVEPKRLSFNHLNEARKFSVSDDDEEEEQQTVYCFLRWIDQHSHVVSSPIVVLTLNSSSLPP
ncbi:Subtilisin-like protease SBT1.6 [Linum grandiflorum]